MNLHGAIDLEGGQTRMREVLTVDAMSTIELVMMSWTFPFAGGCFPLGKQPRF